MTIEVPVWLQNGEYPARLDRGFIRQVMRGQQRVFEGLQVTERAAGPNFTIDVSVGAAAIGGTDTSDQGFYFVDVTGVENIDVPASPGSDPRIDLVVLRVRDPQAGGPAGDDAVIEIVEGSPAASPSQPATPPSSVALARIARTSGEGAILNSAITDLRPVGQWPYRVSTQQPSGRGVMGDLWVRVQA